MPRALFQNLLLVTYRQIRKTGLLKSRMGKRVYEEAYLLYKRFWEASDSYRLAQWIEPGDYVIDVGANLGFFTHHFLKWVGDQGKVIAIEPETTNLRRLKQRFSWEIDCGKLSIFEGVATDYDGSSFLEINLDHSADHKIATSGVPIQAYTLDAVIRSLGWDRVDFIKVDVQGAEEKVIQGARELLQQFQPALWVEVDDAGLRQMGDTADTLIHLLDQLGYQGYQIQAKGQLTRAEWKDIQSSCLNGSYTDILFLKETSKKS